MTTELLSLFTEAWTTELGKWGRKFSSNTTIMDLAGELVYNSVPWSAGNIYDNDDIIFDRTTGLIFKANTTFTVPANTSLFEYSTDTSTRNNITYADPSVRLYTSDSSGFSIPVEGRYIYNILYSGSSASFSSNKTITFKDNLGVDMDLNINHLSWRYNSASLTNATSSIDLRPLGVLTLITTGLIGNNVTQGTLIIDSFDNSYDSTPEQFKCTARIYRISGATDTLTTMEISADATNGNTIIVQKIKM